MAFDLDALIAEQPKLGPRKKKFSFTFDGKEYTLPNEPDAIALDAAIRGDFVTVLRRLVTPEAYQEIEASTSVLTAAALREMFQEYYLHIGGLAAGESSASSSSSKSTAGPSKRTSTGSTRRATSRGSVRKR